MTKDQYLREVAWELRDLPWRKRRDLVADLRGHLDEVPPDQLESPKSYAAELREAAGLERRHGIVAFLQARRPLTLVLVAVLVVVGALLGVAYSWVESYQPLVAGSSSLTPIQSRTGAAGETIVAYRDGRPIQFGFSVRNSGGFDVRVVGVPLAGPSPFAARLFVSGPLDHGDRVPGPLDRFKPFDLKPGEERMLVFRGVFAHCRDWSNGTGTQFDAFPVRFSFLWRHETVRIPASSPLVIRVPEDRRCRP